MKKNDKKEEKENVKQGSEHLLQCTIRSMLRNTVSKFNMRLVEDVGKRCHGVIDGGKLLDVIMAHANKYIGRNVCDCNCYIPVPVNLCSCSSKCSYVCANISAISNIVKLIKFVINITKDWQYLDISEKIILNAIDTNDQRIIGELLIGLKSNISKLELAQSTVKKMNPEIMRIISQHPIICDDTEILDNLLAISISVLNLQITHELIISGASEPYGYGYGYGWGDLPLNSILRIITPPYETKSLVKVFYKSVNKFMNQKQDNDSIDQMMRLIMCSGAKVPVGLYNKIIVKTQKMYIDNLIIDYYNYIHGSNIQKNALKEKLMETMNELMTNSNHKKTMIKEMELIMRSVPYVCIEIIYGYQEFKSKVEFIDWSKY